MKNTFFFCLAVIAAATLLHSCSSSDSPNNPGGSTTVYMPLTNGNSWTYQQYQLDTVGAVKLPATEVEANDKVVGTVSIGGKQASIVATSVLGIAIDTTHYNQTGDVLSVYSDLGFITDLTGNKQITWRPWVDFGKTAWTALDTTIADVSVYKGIVSDIPVDLRTTGTLKTTGAKTGSTTLTVDGKELQAIEYTVTTVFSGALKGSATISGFPLTLDPFLKPLTVTMVSKVWFAENVGIVKVRQEPYAISIVYENIPLAGSGSFEQKEFGSERVLIKYTVATPTP